MTRRGSIKIDEEQRNYIERYWGPINSLTDKDALEIVQERIADPIVDAYFEDDETIRYEWKDRDEQYDDYDDIRPAWTEKYLNTLGMSLEDF